MNIQQSEELVDWIDSKIRNLEILGGRRDRFSASCFDIVHEHHRSIVLLVANRLYGSAFALVRPTYETLVRGVWIWTCATDEQIQEIMEKDKIGHSYTLVSDIEKKNKNFGQVLNEIREKHWSSLSSFTHTGFRQIARRNTQEHIEPNYDEHEIERIIEFADALALLERFTISCSRASPRSSGKTRAGPKRPGRGWGAPRLGGRPSWPPCGLEARTPQGGERRATQHRDWR